MPYRRAEAKYRLLLSYVIMVAWIVANILDALPWIEYSFPNALHGLMGIAAGYYFYRGGKEA